MGAYMVVARHRSHASHDLRRPSLRSRLKSVGRTLARNGGKSWREIGPRPSRPYVRDWQSTVYGRYKAG